MTAQNLANITRRPLAEMQNWIDPLQNAMERFHIATQDQRAMFLAQIALESGGFSQLQENLNYSARRLVQVFPRHFHDEQFAARYAMNPKAIANRVYRNRYGNGNEESGDGWKYRGRGLKQLTFKVNYESCSKGLGVDLVQNPDLLLHPEYAALSAAWFWDMRDINVEINKYSANRTAGMDDWVIQRCTRLINGGLNGLKDREIFWERAKKEVLA